MNRSPSAMSHYESTMPTVPMMCPFPKHVQARRFVDFSRKTGAHSSACESWAVQGGGAGSSAVVCSFFQPEGPHLKALKTAGGQYLQAGPWVWPFVFRSLCSQCCSWKKYSVALVSVCTGRMWLWHKYPWRWLHPAHLHPWWSPDLLSSSELLLVSALLLLRSGFLHISVSLLHCWKELTSALKYFPLLNQSLCTCMQTY